MTATSFGIAVTPRQGGVLLTGPMALGGLTLAACLVTRLSGLDHGGVSFCYFKNLTGYACFTCGTTRAFGHLARFDLPAAFAVQPLVTAGALGILLWGAVDAALLPVSKRTTFRLEGRALRIVTAVGVVVATLNWFYLLATGV